MRQDYGVNPWVEAAHDFGEGSALLPLRESLAKRGWGERARNHES